MGFDTSPAKWGAGQFPGHYQGFFVCAFPYAHLVGSYQDSFDDQPASVLHAQVLQDHV